MPVDPCGLVFALMVWIGGTIAIYRLLRVDRPIKVALVQTLWGSVFLFGFGIFIVWFYDWLTIGRIARD